MECPVEPGQVLADKYRVERILGHGGMGVVVLALHIELDQQVAMKFLLPSLAENVEAAERFRREARAAVKIRSEHVARVLDVGTMDGGVPYMVMEYLEGNDLATEIHARGRMLLPRAAQLVLDACEAIAAAHSVGIIHRDLKPANLFLTRRADHSACLKVLDFGISKSLVSESSGSQLSLTRTRAMVGSPLYMSPEQLESARNADQRADIWSLGVILYELVTGEVPFQGESLPQLVRAVLTADRQRVDYRLPDLGPDLDDRVIERCLAQSKHDRFESVADLGRALAPFAAHGPESASRIERILRPMPASSFRVDSVPPTVGSESPALSSVSVDYTLGSYPKASSSPERSSSGTVGSFGRTSPTGIRRTAPWLLAGVTLAVAAGGIFWAVQGDRAPEPLTASTTGEPLLEGAASAAEAVPEPRDRALTADREPARSAQDGSPAGGEGSAEPSASALAAAAQPSAAASASAASAPAASAPAAVSPPVRPAPQAARPRAHRAAPPPAAAPATASVAPTGIEPDPSFTDFGGRR